MGKIIALKGRAESGKSTTIGLLPQILIANGYTAVPGSRESHGKDFLEIYAKGTYRLGITSAGDTHDLVHQRITTLVTAKCDDIICACRTFGGTHVAINSFSGFTPDYVTKTYASSAAMEASVNSADANTLFSRI
ncbi:MAG TPA: hypothetical protein VHA56_22180 [Mucilaginibacter sp.]|nr:hypothetical protein [Mucilaginibacter sp.]